VLGDHGAISPRQAKTKTSFPLDVTLCDDGKYARLNLTDMCLDSRRACEALTLLRNQHGCTPGTYVFARGTDGQAVLPKNAASDFFAKATSSNVGALRNRIETDADALVKVEKLTEADASWVTNLLQHTPKTRERNYVARSRGANSPTTGVAAGSAAAGSAASGSVASGSAASGSAASGSAASGSQTSSDEEPPPSTDETNSNDTVTATAASVATQTEEVDWIAAVATATKRLFRAQYQLLVDDSALVTLNCAIALAEYEGDLGNERAKRMLSRATAACDMAMEQARKRQRN
jgi:hypothetical protein